MSEEIIENAEVSRREAVKMAALAVGAVALGGAGVAGVAPDEALAASKKKYKCKGCGKKYATAKAATACLRKHQDADWAKIKKLTKQAAKELTPAVDLSVATQVEGEHIIYINSADYWNGKPGYYLKGAGKYTKELKRALPRYSKTYKPLLEDPDGVDGSYSVPYKHHGDDTDKVIPGNFRVKRSGKNWTDLDGTSVNIAPGETIEFKVRLALHIEKDGINCDKGSKKKDWCVWAPTKWSKSIEITNPYDYNIEVEFAKLYDGQNLSFGLFGMNSLR